MGMQDKIIKQVTGAGSKQLAQVLESIHAHLELQLETQREILNELREQNKKDHKDFKDDLQ